MDVKFLADTKMADSKRELEMQKASFNQEVNTKVIDRSEYPVASIIKHDSRVLIKPPASSRKQRLSWHMSCRQPKSSRRYVWRR